MNSKYENINNQDFYLMLSTKLYLIHLPNTEKFNAKTIAILSIERFNQIISKRDINLIFLFTCF